MTANKQFVRAGSPGESSLGSQSDDDASSGTRITPFPRAAENSLSASLPPQPTGVEAQIRPMKVAIALLVAIVGIVAWIALRDPAVAPTATAVPPPVELAAIDIAAVELRTLSRSLPLSGSLSPIVQATLKSKVGGEVELVPLREGHDVREGEVIARIDSRNLQAQYERELAAVERARADLQLATLNRDKNRALLEQRYISQNTYEATESAYAASVADLKLAEAQARVARMSVEDAVIRAPFAGTIARRHVQPGEKVSADSPIVTLVDLREMMLEAAVPATDIPSVDIGQRARFEVGGFGAHEFAGQVQRINPMAADGSRAIAIYIAVPNPDRTLKGGMFAQGELTLDAAQPVLCVAERAVREDGGGSPYVYALRDDKIVRTPVSVGPAVAGSAFVEVRGGLTAGDRVIVTQLTAEQAEQRVLVRS